MLIGCSTSTPATLDGGSALDADKADHAEPGDAAACPCNPLDDGGGAPAETTLACYCGSSGCKTYDAAVAEFCHGPNASYFKVTESMFDGCGLKVLKVAGSLSGGTQVYDKASGALLGAIWQGDVVEQCPSTKREHVGFAAGAYTVPPSCERTSQRNPCEAADSGVDANMRD